jgi:hypothetical protein
MESSQLRTSICVIQRVATKVFGVIMKTSVMHYIFIKPNLEYIYMFNHYPQQRRLLPDSWGEEEEFRIACQSNDCCNSLLLL